MTASLQAAHCESLRAGTGEGSGFSLCFSAFAGPGSSPGITPVRLYVNSKYQRETSQVWENIAGKGLLSNGVVKAATWFRENGFNFSREKSFL